MAVTFAVHPDTHSPKSLTFGLRIAHGGAGPDGAGSALALKPQDRNSGLTALPRSSFADFTKEVVSFPHNT